jgi:hypothetical protein
METAGTSPTTAAAPRLRNFLMSFFSVVTGLGGHTIAWQRAGTKNKSRLQSLIIAPSFGNHFPVFSR